MYIKTNLDLVRDGNYRMTMYNDLSSLIQFGTSLIKLILIAIKSTLKPTDQVMLYSDIITQTKLKLSEFLKYLKTYRDEYT